MKNVLFQQKKIKLWNKRYFVQNNTEIVQRVLQMQHISLLPKYIKLNSRGVFLRAVAYSTASLWDWSGSG
jgi:hypothetical protein